MVRGEQHPAMVAEEMTLYELEIVAVIDDDVPLGVASALDVLGALVQAAKEEGDTKE